MGEDSRKPEVGELNQNSHLMEVITWKIPNVSSILFAVDYGVQSPPFSFAGATWILEIYFCGQSSGYRGYIEVVIQRLHSEIEVHNFSCKICCKNVFGEEVEPESQNVSFHPNQTSERIRTRMENFQEKSNKWEVTPNDTFTIVYEIIHKRDVVEKETAGKKSTQSKNARKPEVGEIHRTSYQLETVKWTIGNASSLPSPGDHQVQSPPFSFASASWTLKIYPHFRLTNGKKQSFSVVLMRVHSRISEHYVLVNVCFKECKNKFNKVIRPYIFDSNHIQGDAICFTLEEQQFNIQHDILTLICKLRIKNSEREMYSLAKYVESASGDDCKSGSSLDLRTNKVLQDLKALFLKQEDCDVIIKVKGQEFPAHRAILKARSPVFDSTLRNDMKEKATGVIDIEDCDPITFSDFLCFLYCGDLENLSMENVFSLFTTADKYEVLDLRSKCMQFIKKNLSVDTFCETITLALQYSESGLIQLCTYFFAKNLEKIIVTVKWQSFLAQNPTESNELFVKALVADKHPSK